MGPEEHLALSSGKDLSPQVLDMSSAGKRSMRRFDIYLVPLIINYLGCV